MVSNLQCDLQIYVLYHVQVTIWSGPSVLGGWCSASCWHLTASPSISQLQNTRRSSDTEQFWRQRLFCCRT